jgi:DinB family protein
MGKVTIARPATNEYAPFYGGYVSLVPDGDLLDVLEGQGRETVALLRGVDEKKSQHRYAPGKWTIRAVAGHMADAERVFTYRALRFARGDATPLPSFDENAWAESSNAGDRPMSDLVADLAVVRAASLGLFRGFTESEWARGGIASANPITVRALAYITAGHERHHIRILRERYGV